MVDIDNVIVSLRIFEEYFVCDINDCRGICCVEGDAGAPLDENEINILKDTLHIVYNELRDEAKNVIDNFGVYVIDNENEKTTPLCKSNGECVYMQYNKDNISYCVFEKLFEEGIINFQKPISCHLYPARIKKYKDFEAINFNYWEICSNAKSLGKQQNIKVYQYLKTALTRKYGTEWYNKLCIAADMIDSKK